MYILVLQRQSSSNPLYSKLIRQSPFLCVSALGKSLAQGRTQQKNSRFHSDHSWKHLFYLCNNFTTWGAISCRFFPPHYISGCPEQPLVSQLPLPIPPSPPASFLQAVFVLCLYSMQSFSNKTILTLSPWTSPWFPAIIFCLFSRPALIF